MLARAPLDRAERRRWLLGLLVLSLAAIAVRWPAVAIGRLSDDYMQYAMIEGLYPGEGYAPFDLYAFVRRGASIPTHVEQGTVPWFTEPGFHGAVFRPLASLLLWLDHVVAPGRVRLWHLHSLLWFGASVVALGMCARRLLARWPAALVVVLYACEAAFVSPLGWLANRCVLVCAVFGFAAIWVHIEWRRPDPDTPGWLRRGGPVIELVLVALSLAAGEYGLGVVGYVFAWELCVGASGAELARDGWRVRARALIPALVATLAYLATHKLLGYGTVAAEVYADPLHAPAGWFKWAKLRIPKLATGALWAIPSATIYVFRHPAAAWWYERWPSTEAMELHVSHAKFGLLGVGLAGVALTLARFGLDEDERRTLRAMLLGGFLTLLPVSVAPAHSRLLVITQLGACVAVALIVVGCARLLLGRQLGVARSRARVLGALLLPFALTMLWLNTVTDLRWTHRYLVHLDAMQAANAAAFTEGDLLDQELAGRDVFVMNGPSQSVGMYGPFVLHANGMPTPASWRSLALGGDYAIWVFRPSDKVLELAAIRGAWLRTAGELFFRREDHKLPSGSKFDYPSVDIEVVLDDAGDPTRVRFTFPRSLDDPRYLFLASTKAGLMRWEMIPVEGSDVVPRPGLPYVGTSDVLFTVKPNATGPK
ncbi:hypothetical protein ENSA5_30740 [Enhygromyxa salina]|uniref:Glycosyltransferase RgtA/B/C/D-like domain-containing protein n=1 Tax=Enhygromyxa salina TaxID=215803 RepID=A0A2S9XZ16_9BACT|nr:hypothetical protein [Enhygromyxa salina]PRP98089.1 hypothetical protein ENSA5_30740 [Enhygromyxa salina]